MAKIWVYAELDHGTVAPSAFELLTKARDLGEAEAVVLGPGATEAAAKLGEYGAQTVYASDDAELSRAIERPGGGLTPVAGFFHASASAEAEMRGVFRRVHVCRQYLRASRAEGGDPLPMPR